MFMSFCVEQLQQILIGNVSQEAGDGANQSNETE